jgi:aspartate racemase
MRPGTTLGVLGGMGPSATAEFLRLLADRAPARTDQEHPRVVMLSEPSIPDRTESLLRGDDTPLILMRDSLRTLVDWGAGLLAVPCNTAHAYLERFAPPAPLVDIVDETLAAARAAGPRGAWLAATTGTVASGIYQRRAAELGFPLLLPDEVTQTRVHHAATLVKANRTDDAADALDAAAHTLWARAPLPLLTACTELPIAYDRTGLPPERAVSSLAALATGCVRRLYSQGHQPADLPATG